MRKTFKTIIWACLALLMLSTTVSLLANMKLDSDGDGEEDISLITLLFNMMGSAPMAEASTITLNDSPTKILKLNTDIAQSYPWNAATLTSDEELEQLYIDGWRTARLDGYPVDNEMTLYIKLIADSDITKYIVLEAKAIFNVDEPIEDYQDNDLGYFDDIPEVDLQSLDLYYYFSNGLLKIGHLEEGKYTVGTYANVAFNFNYLTVSDESFATMQYTKENKDYLFDCSTSLLFKDKIFNYGVVKTQSEYDEVLKELNAIDKYGSKVITICNSLYTDLFTTALYEASGDSTTQNVITVDTVMYNALNTGNYAAYTAYDSDQYGQAPIMNLASRYEDYKDEYDNGNPYTIEDSVVLQMKALNPTTLHEVNLYLRFMFPNFTFTSVSDSEWLDGSNMNLTLYVEDDGEFTTYNNENISTFVLENYNLQSYENAYLLMSSDGNGPFVNGYYLLDLNESDFSSEAFNMIFKQEIKEIE